MLRQLRVLGLNLVQQHQHQPEKNHTQHCKHLPVRCHLWDVMRPARAACQLTASTAHNVAFYSALRPRTRGGLLRTGTGGEGDTVAFARAPFMRPPPLPSWRTCACVCVCVCYELKQCSHATHRSHFFSLLLSTLRVCWLEFIYLFIAQTRTSMFNVVTN